MLLYAIRFLFVVLVLALTMTFITDYYRTGEQPIDPRLVVLGAFAFALIVVLTERLAPRRSLRTLGGLFFGLLVGMVIGYALSLLVGLIAATFVPPNWPTEESRPAFIGAIKLLVGLVSCYLCISFVLQTKDDVRFIIPYVEFSKQAKGTRPVVLDTSTIIDGRIADVCETGVFDAPLIVPRFVLTELQGIADSSDRLKRNRGRRGLDVLNKLQQSEKGDVQIREPRWARRDRGENVDQKLVALASELDAKIITADFNLAKVAQLRGVEVINLNDLSNALKPVVLPGESLNVKIIRPGEEANQGIGYLDDGTMVVIEGGRDRIGQDTTIIVTSWLQTSAGRMLFGRTEDTAEPPRSRTKRPNGPQHQSRHNHGSSGTANRQG